MRVYLAVSACQVRDNNVFSWNGICNCIWEAVVKTANDKDGRVTTLTKNVGNEKAITSYNSFDTYQESELYQLRADDEKYKEYKRESLAQLRTMVN